MPNCNETFLQAMASGNSRKDSFVNVTIVGGGLTGLTAAYYLGHAKPEWNITLYEQAPRFGGKIQTQRVDDFVVELGPDSYLGRKN